MAIFHLTVKPVKRSAGRSATAAAAYRAGQLGAPIIDERTREIHDFTRKRGVISADIVLPAGSARWALDRSSLWNEAERAERRKDACVAREYEVALPAELSAVERRRLTLDFAQELADREGCAIDVCIHQPGRGGDGRNYHAHLLRTTRKVDATGLGGKLETEKAGRSRSLDLHEVRFRWEQLTNERLRESGSQARIDRRSLAEQGVNRVATKHRGAAATGYERRTGLASESRTRHSEVLDRQLVAEEVRVLKCQAHETDLLISQLSAELNAAKWQLETHILERVAHLADGTRPFDESAMVRQELDAVSAPALRSATARTRPAPLAELASRDQDVVVAVNAALELAGQYRKRREALEAARQEKRRWREEHPLLAKWHKVVLIANDLAKLDASEATSLANAKRAQQRMKDAERSLQEARELAEQRCGLLTTSARRCVALLEDAVLRREAEAAFQSARARMKACMDFAELAEQHSKGLVGFRDGDPEWSECTPEALRNLVARYNRMRDEDRELVLSELQLDANRASMLGRLFEQRHTALHFRELDLDWQCDIDRQRIGPSG